MTSRSRAPQVRRASMCGGVGSRVARAAHDLRRVVFVVTRLASARGRERHRCGVARDARERSMPRVLERHLALATSGPDRETHRECDGVRGLRFRRAVARGARCLTSRRVMARLTRGHRRHLERTVLIGARVARRANERAMRAMRELEWPQVAGVARRLRRRGGRSGRSLSDSDARAWRERDRQHHARPESGGVNDGDRCDHAPYLLAAALSTCLLNSGVPMMFLRSSGTTVVRPYTFFISVMLTLSSASIRKGLCTCDPSLMAS